MIKKLRILLGVTLSLAMILTVASGCKKQTSTSSSKTSSEPITLSVEVFDRGVQGQAPVDNNYITQYIQQKFGTPNNITMKFVPVTRSQEIDKLNILMASNTAPDICFTYDTNTVYNYVNQGGLTDLSTYLKSDGKDLQKYLGSKVLTYGVFSGKQYVIPAKRILQGMTNAYIRQDWLDKLSLKVPTTTNELYNYLKLVKEKNPGGLGTKTIPMSVSINTTSDYETSYDNVIRSFITKQSDEDSATLPVWKQAGAKEGYRFLNKLYNEGLISPDFALDKDGKKSDSNVANGRVGFVIENSGYIYQPSTGIESSLEKNVSGAKMVPCDPLTNYEGKRVKLQFDASGIYNFVPKFSKNAQAAIKYLNWMSNQDNLFYLQFGEKGVDYNVNSAGYPQLIPQTGDRKIGNHFDYYLILNGTELGNENKNITAQKFSFPGFEDLFVQGYKMSTTDPVYKPHYTTAIKSAIKYDNSLITLNIQLETQCITCKTSDFDATFANCVNQYLNQGGQEIITEEKAAYAAEYAKK
jgi:putative aldouronate transport system substrate-binding protein